MKKLFLTLTAILMIAVFTTKTMAQVTENTAAGAKILTALSIAENLPLHFGTMGVLAGTGGTCVLTTAGVRSATSGVTLSAMAPLKSLATYTVTGEATYTYAITIPDDVEVTYTTEHMHITTWLAKSTSGSESHTATGTIEGGGTEQFTVGATLNVSAGQVAGVYAGTFDVTVAYN